MPAKKPKAAPKPKAPPRAAPKAAPVKRKAPAPPPKKAPAPKPVPKKKEGPPPIPKHVTARIQDVRQAIARPPRTLSTFPSAEAARLRGAEGLVQLPYLTINDLLALRKAGFKDIEDLETKWARIPEEAWTSVMRLVEARVLRLPTELPREFIPAAG